MSTIAAVYLAHLNPLTKAHESIISNLKKDYRVYVFPVRFIKDGREINTKSFPFPYEVRKSMVESVFGDSVSVFPDYTFYAPYVRYMPPLLSPRSWELRRRILARIKEEKFVSYTGDRAERVMLKAYRLNPLKAARLEISATSVKEELYRQSIEGRDKEEKWSSMVPPPVTDVIRRNWDIIDKFAGMEDKTTRVMGMKFPKEGYK
ncbi:MAG: hypothetical protein HRF40_13390 [Nitrososphaera sp.]